MVSCGPDALRHFCGKRRVTIAICETVAVSNTGAGSHAKFSKDIGIPPGLNTLRGLRQKDKERLKSAAQKMSLKYLKAQLRKQRSSKTAMDGFTTESYIAGGFAESALPEIQTIKTPLNGTKRRAASKRDGIECTTVETSLLPEMIDETEDTQMGTNIQILFRVKVYRISGRPDNPAPDNQCFKTLVPAGFVLKIRPSTGFS